MPGKLILIGGGEVKRNCEDCKSELLAHIFRGWDIKSTTVIFPPSDEKQKGVRKYQQVFKKITGNLPQFILLDENSKTTEADIEKIKKTHLIYFGGGQQKKYMSGLSFDFIKEVQNRFYHDNVFIAGTSAGAMIFSDKIIAEGSNAESQLNDELNILPGINLLPNFIIDTHFIQRSRFARLAHAVKRYPDLIGLGIEANSALFFENDHLAKCYGDGPITIVDGSNIQIKTISEKDSVFNLTVHLLAAGCTIDFKNLKQMCSPDG